MNRRALIGLAVFACAGPLLHADVTIRYQTDFKVMPALQPLIDTLMKAQGTGSGPTVRMKGDKAYATSGNFIQIFDFVKQEVTLLDPAHKTFAVVPVPKLADALAAAMPKPTAAQNQTAQDLMASIKTTAESKTTGQTAVIQGVQAEERLVTIAMDMPIPGAAGNQASAGMKLVMHVWTAKPSEALNVPAIRELTGYNAWQKYVLNPAGILEKMTGKMPAIAEAMRPLVDEMTKNQTVIMRVHIEVFTPMTAMIAQKMAKQGQDAPAIDPEAPLMEMNQEVAELSSDPVDAALFEVPKDYTSVPAADLFGAVMQVQAPAAPAAP